MKNNMTDTENTEDDFEAALLGANTPPLDTLLQSDFGPDAIQGAYNVIYTQFQQDNERACFEILKDQEIFRSFCQNHSS